MGSAAGTARVHFRFHFHIRGSRGASLPLPCLWGGQGAGASLPLLQTRKREGGRLCAELILAWSWLRNAAAWPAASGFETTACLSFFLDCGGRERWRRRQCGSSTPYPYSHRQSRSSIPYSHLCGLPWWLNGGEKTPPRSASLRLPYLHPSFRFLWLYLS